MQWRQLLHNIPKTISHTHFKQTGAEFHLLDLFQIWKSSSCLFWPFTIHHHEHMEYLFSRPQALAYPTCLWRSRLVMYLETPYQSNQTWLNASCSTVLSPVDLVGSPVVKSLSSWFSSIKVSVGRLWMRGLVMVMVLPRTLHHCPVGSAGHPAQRGAPLSETFPLEGDRQAVLHHISRIPFSLFKQKRLCPRGVTYIAR